MSFSLWKTRPGHDVLMKKIIIVLLLFSFCGDNSEIFSNRLAVRDSQTALKVNEIALTTNQKIINNTTTTSTTIYDWEVHYLRLDNFKKAWEKTLKEPITLTKEEMDLTDHLYSLWIWKGDKWTPENENFYEIKVNGQICKRIWNSMGYAWLDEIHPAKNIFTEGYVVTERYMCDSNSDFEKNSLFGAPFYYQGKWWIYQTYEFSWDQLDCKKPCGKSVQYHATRVPVDLDDEIYNITLPVP